MLGKVQNMNDKVTKNEINKWLNKMEEKLGKVKIRKERGNEFLENINAYVHDCKYFMRNGDFVRSFEAIIWAWAWLEIGEKLEVF